MAFKISYLSPLVHYLTVSGKYLTPNQSVFPNASTTGTLGSSTLTDWKITPALRELALNFTVQQGSGSLAINLLVLDPIESSNGISAAGNPPVASLPIVPGSSPITGNAVVRLTLSRSGDATTWINNNPTSLGSFPVPFKWQVQLNIQGSFGIIGTFEGRE